MGLVGRLPRVHQLDERREEVRARHQPLAHAAARQVDAAAAEDALEPVERQVALARRDCH